MRKLLLFALAIGIGVSTMAQVNQLKQQAVFNNTKVLKKDVLDPQGQFQGETPITSTSSERNNSVGTTYYDVQTNSGMAQRIWVFDDGTIGAVWTRGAQTGPPSFPERGTGYNYYDGSSWGPDPSARIEDTRVGWTNYASYGANGEIVCAHTGGNTGLMFSYRENKGTGDWQHFTLQGPAGHETLIWPRIMTSGENHETIQVIALTEPHDFGGSEYQGLFPALLYSRSDDGGQTWDPENAVLNGMGSDYTNGYSADAYTWAIPRGDTIAFVVFDGVRDGFVMKSFDNGDTWEKITFYDSPFPFFLDDGNMPRTGGGDGSNAIALDENGMAHVAFGRMVHIDETADDFKWSYYPYTDGLVYWNETMPALDSGDITNGIIPDWENHPLYQKGELAAWTQPNGDDTIHGVATYGIGLTSFPQIAITKDADGQDIVTFFYSGLAVGFVNTEKEQNYRHIWTRKTELDGIYNGFEDLTGDITHIFSECVFPSMFPANNTFHILYQEDNIPGTFIPAGSGNHDAVNNDMIYMTVSPFPVNVNNVNDISFKVMQNIPNPTSMKTTIVVNVEKPAAINLTISNMLGQQVYTEDAVSTFAGPYSFNIDVSDFNTGVYFYTVTVGDKSVSKKMIVK